MIVPLRILRGWRLALLRRFGIMAPLYAAAGLLLAALALQSGGSLHVAGTLKSAATRLVADGMQGDARAERVQDSVTAAIARIAQAAPLPHGHATLPAYRAAHAEAMERLRAMLAAEAEIAADAAGLAALTRVRRAAEELDLTARALLTDPADRVLARRVFTVSATRLAEDVRLWRATRWQVAQAAAAGLRGIVEQVVLWAGLAGLTAVLVGLGAAAALWAVVRRLGGIAEAVLRLSRHDPHVAIPGRADPGPVGDVARAVAALARDVYELERREEAQAQTRQLLDAALNSMVQGLVTLDRGGALRLWNRRFAVLLGLPNGLLRPGITLAEVLAACPSSAAAALAPPALAPPADAHPGAGHRGVVALGNAQVLRAHWLPMGDGGWLGTFEDITRLHRNEARLVHLARHDALTDLPNRAALREAISRAMAQTVPDAGFAVLSVNLDRFRTVNESLGHEAGDALLRQAAERLRRAARAGDTIARIGADGFAIVQTAGPQPAGAEAFAHRLIEVLSAPYEIGNTTVVVGASIGIALPDVATARAGGKTGADTLLRNADLARQRAREDGGGRLRLFEPAMDAQARERRHMELDLRLALERGEFDLHYQPLVSVRTRRINGFEALLRWRHPERGMVRPDIFIPLAEEVGLIGAIGEWVLRRACAQAAAWPEEVSVAVNLSPLQFARDGLVEEVEAAIAEAGLAPNRLELEITERVLLRESADTLAILHRLRGLGVRISMDDFGTGYSSLSYLRSFPFDKIKIDKSFVHGLDAGTDDGEADAIVRAIAGLGRSLGIATTAEGVETVAQLNALVADGCTEMQGYLFSPPRPAAEVPRLLAVSQSWPAVAAAAQPKAAMA
jgi:diguanylate cyclase (GGDEF)-like protein